jgi:putative tryptophan/tyrosine transport system substrate-binding protein
MSLDSRQTVLGPTSRPIVTAAGRGIDEARFRAPLNRNRAEALYLANDGTVDANRLRINILALGARLPTMWSQQENVEAGGLMSYGPSHPDQWRRAADYVDKILRGAKPADLPVEQPVKFELVVNLVVAKALGLEIPPTLLARADEVIE